MGVRGGGGGESDLGSAVFLAVRLFAGTVFIVLGFVVAFFFTIFFLAGLGWDRFAAVAIGGLDGMDRNTNTRQSGYQTIFLGGECVRKWECA